MEDRVTITILGKERSLTLEELVEVYKSIGDPNPEMNAHANFYVHKEKKRMQDYEALTNPEEILKVIHREFSNDYDYNLGYFGGSVPNEIFSLAKKLPLKELEEFASTVRDEKYSKKFKEIIDEKKENENNKESSESNSPDSNNQSEPDKQ